MNFLFTIAIYNLLFFTGRGFAISVSKLSGIKLKESVFGVFHENFYIIYTLFLIGNLSFLLNFFTPINKFFVLIPIFIFLFFNFNNSLSSNKRNYYLISNFCIPFALTFSTFDIGFHYDAALYHLNFQNWLVNEKIVYGLSNIYEPFGLSSINDYILSNFQINGNFVGLHFLNIAILTSLFSLLFSIIFFDNKSTYKFAGLFVLLFCFFDNFGINGGGNGFPNFQGIGKVDNLFGILFLFIALIYTHIKKENYIDFFDFLIFTLLILFAVQLKIFGALFLLLYVDIFINFYKSEKINYFVFLKFFIFPISLSIFWIIKNYIQTSCLFYPSNITCNENSKWFSNSAKTLTEDTREFHRAYNFDNNLYDWFQFWIEKPENSILVFNFVIFIVSLTFVKKLLFNLSRDFKINNLLIFIFINILVLFFSSPTPRFFIGPLISLVFLSGLNVNSLKIKLKREVFSYSLIFIAFASVIFFPRINSYKKGFENPLIFTQLNIPEVEYVQNNYWGERPQNGELCWININCTESTENILEENLNSFKLFRIIE